MKQPSSKVAKFLAAIRVMPHVSRAANAAGIERRTHYKRLQTDPAYKAEFEAAWSMGIEVLEEEATIRATEGWEEPVFYMGLECGTKRRFSDRLLLARLQAEKPDKYGTRIQHTGANGGAIETNVTVTFVHPQQPEPKA